VWLKTFFLKAKQLQNEAKEELENAKKEVEKIILGDNYEC
jgi:exonuclease VII small subunit